MDNSTPPRILVLGKTGMLGQAVFGRLSQRADWFVRGTQKTDPTDPWYFDANGNIKALESMLAADQYNYVINCIGILSASINVEDASSLKTAIMINALFPHNLASISSNFSARVIHLSTDGVFSGTSLKRYFEDSPIDCCDHYGRSKALGECPADNVLNFRCSIIGRDRVEGKGLFEWFLRAREGTTLSGFHNDIWNGASTVQFARLCENIISRNWFDVLRQESRVYHFCPNPIISKFDLLCVFKEVTTKDVTIIKDRSARPAISRVLATRFTRLQDLFMEKMAWGEIVGEVYREA